MKTILLIVLALIGVVLFGFNCVLVNLDHKLAAQQAQLNELTLVTDMLGRNMDIVSHNWDIQAKINNDVVELIQSITTTKTADTIPFIVSSDNK